MATSTCDIFFKEKVGRLNGVDRSRKGDIDVDIVEIVQIINEHKNYFTTSSCSGRIVVFCQSEDHPIQKKGCQWLLVSHELVETSRVWDVIQSRSDSVILKFEPFVMHVKCRALQDAQKLHTLSLEAGFRNSGLTVNKNGKVTLAIRSTQTLEVPLTDRGNVLISKDYLEYLVKVANKKFEENQRRIRKFQGLIERIFSVA